MGTYPPRACGIATFNQDLLHSSQKLLGASVACQVVAMNLFTLDTYLYPPEVAWKLDQNDLQAHQALAHQFNADPLIKGIIIQHEYGIYGGVDGENLLAFIETCTKPLVVTLHTVLPRPTPHMRAVTQKIVRRANILVVLTKSSQTILESLYPQAVGKLYVIPHGIHDVSFSSTFKAKSKLDLQHTTVLTTFGLLSRNKGIEYVLQALPATVKQHPSLLYLILGETHPVVRRQEGESYRRELAELVIKLHLQDHVKFYDQYLSLKDLFGFLKATDIYISPSINPDQAVSGTLSYALGTGRAVISTAFAQAKEIITPATGRLVPIKQSNAFTQALTELLANQTKLKQMHRQAYRFTRPMLWSSVAGQYSKLLSQFILPPVDLHHLTKMTDSVGLFQFAALDIPNKQFGYTLDDNARALVVCSWLNHSLYKNAESLADTYLNFIDRCQQRDGTFINYLDRASRPAITQNKLEDLEDPSARAMWALSEVMQNPDLSPASRRQAQILFQRGLPQAKNFLHIRSAAFMIKACALVAYLQPDSSAELISCIKENADFLTQEFNQHSLKSWHWFAGYLGYNNAIIPEALLIAGQITENPRYTVTGTSALTFLIQKTFSVNRYRPIGHSHWYTNNGKRSHFDQQPEDPASMILALVTAYKLTGDQSYRHLIAICFSWFLGNNSLQEPLYNYQTGGCFDGLHPDRVNLNQGAESLVSYLLSRLAIATITP